MELKAQLERTLGDAYTLDRELGGGGMSRVFVADERRLGRRVVVKVLAPELGAGLNIQRFEREIRLAASLQQANIVPVLVAGDIDGLPFYTMPFVDGESLRARLAQAGRLSITEVVRILGDVARALAYAHERGVAHRDIKPDNVLLSGGTAVVTDFGIAKALAASQKDTGAHATLTQLGAAIGTPAYMSPEQAAGDPAIDHRTDIYSFGCMAYELLAGRVPFADRTPQRVLAAHMGEAPVPVSELRADTPPALAALVMQCLAKDAAARPQAVADVVRVLDTVTSGDSAAMPAVLLGGRGMFRRALMLYAAAFVIVAVVTRAAIIAIGLPDWVFPGSMVVMALGLPVVLFTGYVHSVTRRTLLSTPQLTPGGSPRAAHGTMATLALKASPHVSWSRTAKGGAYALSAFTLMVAVFMAMRVLGIGPAASLFAGGEIDSSDDLLITDFRAGADTSLANVVTEAVRANLTQSSAFSLVSPAAVFAALERMQRPQSTRVELPVALELAQREGVRAIVDGEVTQVGNGYVIALRLVTADSARELASFRTAVASPADLITGIDKVSRRLRGKVGESLRAVQGSPPLARVTTASLPALQKYTAAVRANREADYPRAVMLAREAVAIDSTFAGGWSLLVTAGTNGQTLPPSALDSAMTQAYRYRDRLPAEAQEYLETRYYSDGPGRDRTRALAVLERRFARDSTSNVANGLANLLGRTGEYARAESLHRWIIDRDPDFTFAYGNVTPSLVAQGKLDDADSILRLARERHPSYLSARLMQAEMRYVRGRLDEYRRDLDTLVASSVPRLRAAGFNGRSSLALIEGRLRDSDRWHLEEQKVVASTGRNPSEFGDQVQAAFRRAWLLDRGIDAAAMLDSALARQPLSDQHVVERPDFLVAITYAVAGQPARARDVLRRFDREADTATRRYRTPEAREALGYIALAEGDARRALSEFAQVTPWRGTTVSVDAIRQYFHLGLAYEAAGQRDSAIAMYERYRDTPQMYRGDSPVDGTFLAKVHRSLGDLYAQQGDRAKAIASYSAFISQWRNADPELQPQVAEVRRRLQALGGG